ncbi:zinc finger protein 347-like [Dreissena polymorpha]|uniref:C2H2-type domain-containing protein n=1 Tax=Dreissena polymorpha TaxID=45954 RepID=A0A9D4M8E6_DREPO|nr:zinc finger protein 347-like [Dreissena polymorpha]XP_052266519.1 zinc finger protein 347-like [Dreissena polymorpha]XP_052266520.1 zinc finger protein 347-like [Dreissena polymorpha]XP_052266521.1 zinc finger protein 347-like [Dreissena polymorpha]XP_052266522.1 zinc finger protein 347-like [Dreissena polymorpha]XP_052266523.1 zinc finger protein 347-like [Dreissena polymorpha]XP_052266524.1 zinc finger protein 347-like [Dreissena polymorpha]XP_052266525.1 zinc finger protein 347-like [D
MMDVDEDEGSALSPAVQLIEDLKSLCFNLDTYGVDTLVFCTGFDDLFPSQHAVGFVKSGIQLHNKFKEYCIGQRKKVQKQDGTFDFSTDYKVSSFLESLDTDNLNASNEHSETVGANGKIVVKVLSVKSEPVLHPTDHVADEGNGNDYDKVDDANCDNNDDGDEDIDESTENEEIISHQYEMDTDGNNKHNVEINLTQVQPAQGSQTEEVDNEDFTNTIPTSDEHSVYIKGKRWQFISLEKLVAEGSKCTICNQSFLSTKGLRDHFYQEHDVKVGYRCSCRQFYATFVAYDRHVSHKNFKQTHKVCLKCKQCFRSEELLAKHTTEAHPYESDNTHLYDSDVDSDMEVRNTCGQDQTKNDMEHSELGEIACKKCNLEVSHSNLLKLHHHNFPDCDKSMQESSEETESKEIKYKNADGKIIIVKYGEMVSRQTTVPYTCEICNYKTVNRSRFKRHMVSHLTKGTHVCQICGKALKGHDSLLRHIKSHNEKPFSCLKCTCKFTNESELNEHEGKCQKEFPCKMCEFTFPSMSALSLHMNRHAGVRPFKCTLCDKAFTSKGSLDRHVAALHSDAKPYKCKICGHSFKVKDNLSRHVKTHQEPQYHCDVCGKSCTEYSNLKKHMRTHTKEKPFVCEVCGKKFGIKALLQNHSRIHTGEKPFQCTVEDCDKTFRSYPNLQQHIRTHVKGHAYICDICGRGFKQPGRLNHHRIGHIKVYRWSCSYCAEKFKSLISFKNHLARTHAEKQKEIEETLNIKIYMCNLCPKKFGQKEDLDRHVDVHKNLKRFKCKICGSGFNDRSNRREHEKTHGGKNKFRKYCNHCRRDLQSHESVCQKVTEMTVPGVQLAIGPQLREDSAESMKTTTVSIEQAGLPSVMVLAIPMGNLYAGNQTAVDHQQNKDIATHNLPQQVADDGLHSLSGRLFGTNSYYQPLPDFFMPLSSSVDTSQVCYQSSSLQYLTSSSTDLQNSTNNDNLDLKNVSVVTESVNLGSYTFLNAGNIESQERSDYKTEIDPDSVDASL